MNQTEKNIFSEWLVMKATPEINKILWQEGFKNPGELADYIGAYKK